MNASNTIDGPAGLIRDGFHGAEPFGRVFGGSTGTTRITATETHILAVLDDLRDAFIELAPDRPSRPEDVDDALRHIRELQRLVLAQTAHYAWPDHVDAFGGVDETPSVDAPVVQQVDSGVFAALLGDGSRPDRRRTLREAVRDAIRRAVR